MSHSTKKRVINGALAVVLVAGAVGVYLSLGDSAKADSSAARTVAVSRGTVISTVSASGNAASAKTSDVSFTSSGTVTAVYVKVGDKVKKNGALAKIDPTEAEKSLATAESSLASAQAQLSSAQAQATLNATKNDLSVSSAQSSLDSAEADLKSAKRSGDANAVSQAQAKVDSAENQLAQAKAQRTADSASASTAQQQASVTSAEEQVSTAQETVEETTLRAPQAGTVMSVAGAVGDEVSSGSSSGSGADTGTGSDSSSSGTDTSSSSSAFVTVANLDKLQVTANVAEADVASVKAGQKAQATFSATDTVVAGTVTEVALEGTTSSNVVQYPVTVTLDEVPAEARPGASVSLVVTTGSKSDVIAVSSSAVTKVGNTSTVAVRKDGVDQVVRVETGLVGNTTTEITSGLAVGDVVVIPTTTTSSGSTSGFPSRAGGGASVLGGGPGGQP